MTARVYDLYDLTSPFVAPTAPAATTTAPTRGVFVAALARNRLFNRSARLGMFATVLLLLGQMLAVTWIGQITGDDNMLLWLAVIAAGNIFAGVLTLLAVRAGMFGEATP